MCAALFPNELLYSRVIGSRRGLKGVKTLLFAAED